MGCPEKTTQDLVTARRDTHLQEAKKNLIQWRYDTWLALYADALPFSPTPLLPDPILDKVASKCCQDIDALIGVGWSHRWAKKHGEDILQALHILDSRCDAERKATQQK